MAVLPAAALVLAVLLTGCGRLPVGAAESCGEEEFEQGSGYSGVSRDCLWTAYTENRAASFSSTQFTVEGDPIVYRVRVDNRKVEIDFDNSRDAFAGPDAGKATSVCQKLKRKTEQDSGRIRFTATGCTGGDRPIFVF